MTPPPLWKFQLESAWTDLSSIGHVSFDSERVWMDCTEEQFPSLHKNLFVAVSQANEAVKDFFEDCSPPAPKPRESPSIDKMLDAIEISPVEGP